MPILISNSMPKSASTLLFYMQRRLFKKSLSRSWTVVDPVAELAKAGMSIKGSFIPDANDDEFLDFVEHQHELGHSLVVKTHSPIGGRLEEMLLSLPDLYMSMCVRDPVDVFFSARDHFRRNGQFQQFQSEERGIRTINRHFFKMYQSIEAFNAKCDDPKYQVPFSRYDRIVENPRKALLDSFPESLRERALIEIVDYCIDFEETLEIAKFNKNIGTSKPRADEEDIELRVRLESAFGEFREKIVV